MVPVHRTMRRGMKLFSGIAAAAAAAIPSEREGAAAKVEKEEEEEKRGELEPEFEEEKRPEPEPGLGEVEKRGEFGDDDGDNHGHGQALPQSLPEDPPADEPIDIYGPTNSVVVDDWEVLSERSSTGCSGSTAVVVSINGSVRSAVSFFGGGGGGAAEGQLGVHSAAGARQQQQPPGASPGLPRPFCVLQRSPSNSTIASEDCCSLQGGALGSSSSPAMGGIPPGGRVLIHGIPDQHHPVAGSTPSSSGCVAGTAASTPPGYSSGGGIAGVDYVEHVVLPTDTLQGICLTYKISAMRLRQANRGFSGNNLLSAPKKLVVPLSRNGLRTGAVREQDRTTREYKVCAMMAEAGLGLDARGAKSYLEQTNWILDDALLAANADREWERQDGEQGADGKSHRTRTSRASCSTRRSRRARRGGGDCDGSFAESKTADGDELGSEYDSCSCSRSRRSGDFRVTLRVSRRGVPVSATFRSERGFPRGVQGGGGAAAVAAASSAVQSTCTPRDILDAAPRHYEGNAIELKDMS